MGPKKAATKGGAIHKATGKQTTLDMKATKASRGATQLREKDAPIRPAADDPQADEGKKAVQTKIDQTLAERKKRLDPVPSKPVEAKPVPITVKEEQPAVSDNDEREIEPGRFVRRDESEQLLRGFDMNTRFGPCMSMSRMERWNRAKRLNLNPPDEVLLTMNAFPEMAGDSLWHGRVMQKDTSWQ